MNLFETVKASVSVPDAAKMYGLRPNHHGMVRSPFHDDRFVEACQMLDYVECLADILTVGDLELRTATVKDLMKDGMIGGLEEKVRRDCAKERGITEYGENERIAG